MSGRSTRKSRGGTPDNASVLGGTAIVSGAAVSLSGLLLYQASASGGSHIAAVGLLFVFAGVFAVDRVGGRTGLSAGTRRRVALGLAALAAALGLAFFAVDYPGFSGAVAVASPSCYHGSDKCYPPGRTRSAV
ncbi:hypothetical protein [uncultured Halorubrum sp.]|jgi:hypothetical protein|uniref:hypothetical protein n=1 Tax=uncultured Halorubrum sp. TaxID=399555 RepID=UPI002606234C|nr:hypothetical protein [uncultured Halorubrum sp.]